MLPVLLISTLLLAQIPLRSAEGGTITGVLKGADGKPAAGVRVAAVKLPEAIKEGNTAAVTAVTAAPAAMSSIGETDTQGRYSLENIPQGRYYISAGRLDIPTYYPGTRDMPGATIVSVMPGATLSDINFTLNVESTGRATPSAISIFSSVLAIPLNIRTENGGPIPVFVSGKFSELQLIGSAGSTSVPLLSAFAYVYDSTSDYRLTMANLPDGYTIQSVTLGALDITKGPLKLSAINQQQVAINVLSSATPVGPPAPTLTITLRGTPRAASSSDGVRVRGRIPAGEKRSIYLSGTPGTIYSDGSFEFNGVRPGLHMIAALDNPDPLGATIAVGKEDIDGVALKPTRVFPANMRLPREPYPLGAIAPGTAIPPATIRGRITEEIAQTAIPEGLIHVIGFSPIAEYTIIRDGRFEMSLLPGTYTLNFQVFGHRSLDRTLTVGTENITLDLTTRRIY